MSAVEDYQDLWVKLTKACRKHGTTSPQARKIRDKMDELWASMDSNTKSQVYFPGWDASLN